MPSHLLALMAAGAVCACSVQPVSLADGPASPADPSAPAVPFVRPVDVLVTADISRTASPPSAMDMSGPMAGMDMSGGGGMSGTGRGDSVQPR
jgi:hypothetical protein